MDLGHEEKLRFFVLEQPEPLGILGLPWLKYHNPVLDWDTALVIKWGKRCEKHLWGTELGSILIESHLADVPPQIQVQYRNLAEVLMRLRLPIYFRIGPGTVQ